MTKTLSGQSMRHDGHLDQICGQEEVRHGEVPAIFKILNQMTLVEHVGEQEIKLLMKFGFEQRVDSLARMNFSCLRRSL